jgi:hypothetical protein
MWMMVVTAAVLALGLLLVTTARATAGGPGCPPPSAQLAAAQPSTPTEVDCGALDEIQTNKPTSTPVAETLDVDVTQTPTETTTQPVSAP